MFLVLQVFLKKDKKYRKDKKNKKNKKIEDKK